MNYALKKNWFNLGGNSIVFLAKINPIGDRAN